MTLQLSDAANAGNLSLTRRLLKKEGVNVNVNETNSVGATPLMLASQGNPVSVVDHLVKKGGADVNLGDNMGYTAVFYAAIANNPAAVAWLADKGDARGGPGQQRRLDSPPH